MVETNIRFCAFTLSTELEENLLLPSKTSVYVDILFVILRFCKSPFFVRFCAEKWERFSRNTGLDLRFLQKCSSLNGAL